MSTPPIALVTGGGTGIGAAIALALARDGLRVALLGRTASTLEATAAAVTAVGGSALVEVVDVTVPEQRAAAVGRVREQGPVSVLVNNAGWGGPYQRLEAVELALWRTVLAVNVEAGMHLAQLVAPGMVERRFGRIINIASIFASISGEGSVPYTAAKHALLGLTRGLAVEYGRFGITANCVSPGYTRTAMLAALEASQPERVAELVARIPVGRLGEPEDIARLVAFLAGPGAGFINGADLVIDGGMLAHRG